MIIEAPFGRSMHAMMGRAADRLMSVVPGIIIIVIVLRTYLSGLPSFSAVV